MIVPPVGDVRSGPADDELRADSQVPSADGLLEDLRWAPVAPRTRKYPIVALRALQTGFLGDGWLGKARFWPSGHRLLLVRLVPDVLFGIPHILSTAITY